MRRRLRGSGTGVARLRDLPHHASQTLMGAGLPDGALAGSPETLSSLVPTARQRPVTLRGDENSSEGRI